MISSTGIRQKYSGDGTTTQFPITFPYEEADDIQVCTTDSLGNITAITTNYTVDTDNNWVVYPVTGSALAAGYTITLVGAPAETQEVNLTSQGPFDPSVVMDMSDRLTLIAQRATDLITRGVVLPDGYAGSFNPNIKIAPSSGFPLPTAGFVVAVDPTGNYLGFFNSAQITGYTPAAGSTYSGSTVQGGLDLLIPRSSGTKASPTPVASSTTLPLFVCADQTWVIEGDGGAVTGLALPTVGFRVGWKLCLIGGDNTNLVTMSAGASGTAIPGDLILAAAPSGNKSAIWRGTFDGTNWQEDSRT